MRSIRLRWWESLLLVPLVLLTALFAVAGEPGTAVVLGAVVVVGVASRATIRERNIAGGYARTRALLLLVTSVALFAIYGVVVWLLFVIRVHHWTRDRHGFVAFWALVGLVFFLAREICRLSEDAGNWLIGSDMEREVAHVLDPLRAEGWLVTHDVRKDAGGNVDHFASGPTGAFAIETKSGANRAAARNQAVANAVWAKKKFGLRWVIGILCVETDPPPQPVKQGHAWVLGITDLAEFLRRPPP
jgi:Nuclease-related domain